MPLGTIADAYVASLAASLSDDGDTVTMNDRVTVRLKITGDEYTDPFTDYDCYGRVGEGRRNADTGRTERPAGFDGNAEKVDVIYGRVWWQPPADVNRSDDGWRTLRQSVIDLASYGMNVYTVEVCEGVDAYRRPVVRAVASLGGIEPFADDGYKREIAGELLTEVFDYYCNGTSSERYAHHGV